MKTTLTLLASAALMIAGTFASAQQTTKTESLTDADQIRISVQKICPVSGQALGKMGTPIKSEIEGETVYLCCAGCKGKAANADHMKTIHSRQAKAQGVCLIMEKPVTVESKSTLVNGQRIFVCCPPCIAKLNADPDAAIAKVNARFTSFVKAEAETAIDNLQIAAQAICPVSGQALGKMGTPIKSKINNETVFLCCAGCKDKPANAEHWNTIQANLAKAQGTCPVTGKALPANAKSIVVEGRRVFYCCDGCIKKIEADPEAYLAKVNESYKSAGK